MRHGRHPPKHPGCSHLVSRSPAAPGSEPHCKSDLEAGLLPFHCMTRGSKAHMPVVSPAEHSTDQSGSQRPSVQIEPVGCQTMRNGRERSGGWAGDPWGAAGEGLYAHWCGKLQWVNNLHGPSAAHRPPFSLSRCRACSGLERTGPPSEEGL